MSASNALADKLMPTVLPLQWRALLCENLHARRETYYTAADSPSTLHFIFNFLHGLGVRCIWLNLSNSQENFTSFPECQG
jgi:hypothetical protein